MTFMKRSFIWILPVVAVAAVSAVMSVAGTAAPPPFAPVGAATSLAALGEPAVLAPPAVLQRLGTDLQPGIGQVHSLGTTGFIWKQPDGQVCTLMNGGPGSCFGQFTKPVVLYLAGEWTPSGTLGPNQIWGIVPDNVRALTVVTDNGQSLPTTISQNAFTLPLGPGVGVAGEQVTLTSGETFYFADHVAGTPAELAPPRPGS
jgi:hypothetical protein